jgi:hypothetical protein
MNTGTTSARNNFIIIQCVREISLFYSIAPIRSMDAPYVRHFLQLVSARNVTFAIKL